LVHVAVVTPILFDLLNGLGPRYPQCICAPPPCAAAATASAISVSGAEAPEPVPLRRPTYSNEEQPLGPPLYSRGYPPAPPPPPPPPPPPYPLRQPYRQRIRRYALFFVDSSN
uniref:Secreted protein n=1 Tax=Angiostrongylus cantonensis TaxID=6313 RepID=A0A0K0DN93_ANGCA